MARADGEFHPVIDRGHRKHWWRRLGNARGAFRFVYPDGRPVHQRAALVRLRRLHIPPAWAHVRISPSQAGRLQALGLDAAGRVQYLYNAKFRAHQDRMKYGKIERFGEHLPNLRRITTQHLADPGFPKERVLAIVVRLINKLYFRIGSADGVRRYRTYGVTTLQNRHLRVQPGGALLFNFDGKHHIHTRRILVDESLALAVAQLKGAGGSCLFKYFDAEGHVHPVRARDVNEYIKAATSPEFSAKDFRTWAGTLLVAKELAKLGKAPNPRQAKRNITHAVKTAAIQLGNTPAVCRRAYLHPTVLRAYLHGIALDDLAINGHVIRSEEEGYAPDELALLGLLQRTRTRSRRAVRALSPPQAPSLPWNDFLLGVPTPDSPAESPTVPPEKAP